MDFLLDNDIALDEQLNQVAVTPDFFEIYAPQLVVRGDNGFCHRG